MSLPGVHHAISPRPGVTGWRPDGSGVRSRGACGGDIQRGDSYSVRLVRGDLPGSLVTITYYAAENNGDSGEYVVQRQITWMVCRDPADPDGTKIWSGVESAGVSVIHHTPELADYEARAFADECLRGARERIEWDGQPPQNGDR